MDSTTTTRFRSPLPPPLPEATTSATQQQQRTISFRHPGYPDIGPNLVSLDAVDDKLGAGIDYDTALVACGIVACNNWSQSWFGVKDSSGASGVFRAVPRARDGVFRESIYYFFINQNQREQYPVIPSFDHWRFPHGDLPEIWLALDIPSLNPAVAAQIRQCKAEGKLAVKIRDESCRLTAWTNATEPCHLIPTASSI